jgi:hypothetical protein
MKTISTQFFLAGIFLFLFAVSCTPSHDTPAHTGPDVYLTGYGGYTINGGTIVQGALYWKNKTQVPLPGGQFATAIALSGTDVYVSGVAGYTGGTTEAVYWKNGVITKIGQAPSYAASLSISGSDQFIAGNAEFNGVYTAAYWKNGVWTNLSQNSGSAAYAIAVSGQDVYIAGKDGTNGTQAVYWKNAVEYPLIQDTVASANAIVLSGNNLYIAGSISVDGSHPTACYWKNGIRTDLIDAGLRPGIDNTYASAIAVSGSDVYVTGFFNSVNPVYWKNGELHELSGGGYENITGNQNGIALFNSDLYISAINGSYWKNDTLTSVGDGYATNILVR